MSNVTKSIGNTLYFIVNILPWFICLLVVIAFLLGG